MKILENKSNYIVMEGDNEIQCYSYNTMVAKYDKILNIYSLTDYYILHGERKKMSPTSRKHQNKFIQEYIPETAKLIK